MRDIGQEELLKRITALLQTVGIPYMITGALSVIFYGRPRASHDIDFVVEVKKEAIDGLLKAFLALPHREFIVQENLIKEAVLHKSMFNVLHLPTMLKLDFFLLKNESFDQTRFKRKKTLTIFDQDMTLASPEDTILIKLLWYEDSHIEKHLIDAAFIYQIQKKLLDNKYLIEWAKKHKTTKLLRSLASIDLEQHY